MDGVQGSSGNERDDMEGREALVEFCLDRLFEAYDLACREGTVCPVVFLVDCEDPLGGPIAREWEGDDSVDSAILAHADSGGDDRATMTTVLTRAASFEDSRADIPALFPYLACSFEQFPRDDRFLVVAISFGGAATFTIPLSARPG